MWRRRGHRNHAEPVVNPATDRHSDDPNHPTTRVNDDGPVNHSATPGDNNVHNRYHVYLDYHVDHHDDVDDNHDHDHDHHDAATDHDNDQSAFRDSHRPAGGLLHEPGDARHQGK